MPVMMINSRQLAERKLNCDRLYRSMIGQLDVMIEFVRRQPGCDLTTELDRLLEAMQDHVASENDFMALAGYPQATKHRLHHRFIFISTTELHYRFSRGLDVLAEELDSIRLLWLDHIHVHDRELEDFLETWK